MNNAMDVLSPLNNTSTETMIIKYVIKNLILLIELSKHKITKKLPKAKV